MNLRQERNNKAEAILEGKFITSILEKEGRETDTDISKRVSGFASSFWANRDFSVIGGNTLRYTHLKQHRYVDMKTRDSKAGKHRKKSYAIHNRPLYGHANQIIKELTVGFTEAVKEELLNSD